MAHVPDTSPHGRLLPARAAGVPAALHQMVGGWMTTPVITVAPHLSLPVADHLMRSHAIHRLPVVDDTGLVGIVTLGDLREARPTTGTLPSLFELSYLLAGTTVAQVMTHQPFTVTPHTPVSAAAYLMHTHNIGGLPVLDAVGRLVGILTESDLLRMFLTRWDADRPAGGPAAPTYTR